MSGISATLQQACGECARCAFSGSPIRFGIRGLGVSFQVQTHKTPLPLPPPSSGRKGLRTGTCDVFRLNKLVLWGCCHICKNEVSFDVAQDREPVERPFHHLRTNGLSLKRDPKTPEFQYRFWTRVSSYIILLGFRCAVYFWVEHQQAP